MPVQFKGDGSHYIPGVPARNLSDEEWQALPEHLRKQAVETGLYEPVSSLPIISKPGSPHSAHDGEKKPNPFVEKQADEPEGVG